MYNVLIHNHLHCSFTTTQWPLNERFHVCLILIAIGRLSENKLGRMPQNTD